MPTYSTIFRNHCFVSESWPHRLWARSAHEMAGLATSIPDSVFISAHQRHPSGMCLCGVSCGESLLFNLKAGRNITETGLVQGAAASRSSRALSELSPGSPDSDSSVHVRSQARDVIVFIPSACATWIPSLFSLATILLHRY